MANDNQPHLAAIRAVKSTVEDDLLAKPEVTGVDIGEKVTKGKRTGQQAIIVYVRKKEPLAKLSPADVIPKEINGIPTDVVEEEIVLQAAAVRELDIAPQVDATKYTTLEGGMSMGPCRSVFLSPPDVPTAGNYVFVGTLGALVKDRTSGAMMALSNFHVACVDSGWSVGDVQCQPGRVDAGSCPADRFGALTRAVLSDHVDGSVTTIDSGRATDCAILEIGDVKGTASASVGMAVRKRGRTTGLTYGTVGSVDYSTSINYGDGLGTHVLKNQIRVDVDTSHSTQFGDHGDSGSAVVNADNKVVGLHFAGNTAGTVGVANPIQFVLDELNVDLCIKGTLILTKPVICEPILTKPIVCYIETKPTYCAILTKPAICSVLTAPALCLEKTKFCPVVTAACPPKSLACGFPPIDVGPGRPPINAGPGDASRPQGWYGQSADDAAEEAFWLGYYSALEAVSQAEGERDEES
jgi:hypothetical protein